MGIINDALEAFRFKDTIFYKEESDLKDKYNALKKLNEEYPNNEELLYELYIVKMLIIDKTRIGINIL